MTNGSSSIVVQNNDNTTSYEDALLAADLTAIFGTPPLSTAATYCYGLAFPVVASLGAIGNLTAAVLFWFVRRYRSHGSGSMASLFVGAQLVADALFLVCFALSTTPAAVLLQYRNAAELQSRNATTSSNNSHLPISGKTLETVSVAQTLFMKTRYKEINRIRSEKKNFWQCTFNFASALSMLECYRSCLN